MSSFVALSGPLYRGECASDTSYMETRDGGSFVCVPGKGADTCDTK